MMTIHYWYTEKQRSGARPDEIEFPSLKLTPSSMRRDQKLRRLSMPPFVNQPTLPSHRRSPEGILRPQHGGALGKIFVSLMQ